MRLNRLSATVPTYGCAFIIHFYNSQCTYKSNKQFYQQIKYSINTNANQFYNSINTNQQFSCLMKTFKLKHENIRGHIVPIWDIYFMSSEFLNLPFTSETNVVSVISSSSFSCANVSSCYQPECTFKGNIGQTLHGFRLYFCQLAKILVFGFRSLDDRYTYPCVCIPIRYPITVFRSSFVSFTGAVIFASRAVYNQCAVPSDYHMPLSCLWSLLHRCRACPGNPGNLVCTGYRSLISGRISRHLQPRLPASGTAGTARTIRPLPRGST